MSKDIYASLSGAMAAWSHVEVIANNLANASTTGFRQQKVAFELVGAKPLPLGKTFVRISPGAVDPSDGPILQDGVSTHLALRGEGYLVVEDELGREVLTRNGTLRLDPDRFLVTADGDYVLGQGGPIQLPLDEQMEIDGEGNITTRRDTGFDVVVNQVDQLRVVEVPDRAGLRSLGGGRFISESGVSDAQSTTVVQGALEGSNTDPMREMVELIQASRYFEVYQRAIRNTDELDSRIYNLRS